MMRKREKDAEVEGDGEDRAVEGEEDGGRSGFTPHEGLQSLIHE